MPEMLKAFRGLQGRQSHPEFSEVHYQEDDGPNRKIRFRSPDAQKAHDDMRAAEAAEASKAAEKKSEEPAKPAGKDKPAKPAGKDKPKPA